jgi:hypothetical protein
MEKKLQIVSFDIPYPPKYGGIIDVFYKIKELHKLGVKIYLHTYIYDNKTEQKELEKYCEKVFYYKRNNIFYSIFSFLPFRVKSRINKELNTNLKSLNFPILFEGLHTIYPLTKTSLKNTFVRAHNIEHLYFYGLAKSENNLFKKIFFQFEAWKLKKFEKHLRKVKGIFTISPYEQNYFSKTYNKSYYIPAFHEALVSENKTKQGGFVLYHGDLRVSDNIKSALFLINIYKDTLYKFVIATSAKEKSIIDKINKYDNIHLEEIPTNKDLDTLFEKAHINTLITFQKTGIKLKLLNTLYKGKHIIANSELIEDTGLEGLCTLANSKEEILQKTALLFKQEFSNLEIQKRAKKLKLFSPEESAKKIIEIIFKH